MGTNSYRDVGLALLGFGVKMVAPGRLFRSGHLDWNTVEPPAQCTIVSLRSEPDVGIVGAKCLHHPFPNDQMKYDGASPSVRNWITSALELIDLHATPPVLVHCAAGVDRTGVLVACILFALSVPPPVIISEYSITVGADPKRLESFMISAATDGFLYQLSLSRPERFAP